MGYKSNYTEKDVGIIGDIHIRSLHDKDTGALEKVDIRSYYEDDYGEMRPTKKGIRIDMEQATELYNILQGLLKGE